MNRRRLGLEATVVAAAATAAVVPMSPQAVERYFSTGLYPAVQSGITSFSNVVPFALLDALGAVGVVIAVRVAQSSARRAWRDRSLLPVAHVLRGLVLSVAAGYLAFLFLWGLNYRRLPMADRFEAQAAMATPEAITNLGVEAARRLTSLHDAAHQAGWADIPLRSAPMRREFAATQRLLSDARPAVPGRLKRSLLGWYFRWAGVDGMINPFGLEVLVNPDLLPFEKLFVAAHEWAHLAGYADESEANFVGFLVCMRGDVAMQYSGWLFLYWQIAGEVDAGARERLQGVLGIGPQRDLAAVANRLRRGEVQWLRTTGWEVYDQYLKANRVESGIKSYSAVVTLIARTRFDPGWVPVRRRAPER